ncbi:MAG: isoprenylcysteine carboxylmethyltransferase family protein [Gemmatimonadota bacterium]|nr:isoprenylcysteine carboxylmethyltransferase family protein [Gemmatimonadota bacterium]
MVKSPIPGHAGNETAGVITPPPLIYLAGLGLGMLLERWWPLPFLPVGAQRPLAAVLFLAGLVLIPALRAMDRVGTRPEPWKPSRALVTDGPYRFTRNPMYLGFTFVYLAATAMANSGWSLAMLPAVLLVMLYGVILREERYMEARFGEAYQAYRLKVRRWL